MISDQNCLAISEHLQPMVMVLLRLELESPLQVLELCWLLHKQRLILHMLVFRMQARHTLAFRKQELHKLVRSILLHMDHTLASGSSAWEASTSASSALAMKA